MDIEKKIEQIAPVVELTEAVVPIHAGKLANLVVAHDKFRPVFSALQATSSIPHLDKLLAAIDEVVSLIPNK